MLIKIMKLHELHSIENKCADSDSINLTLVINNYFMKENINVKMYLPIYVGNRYRRAQKIKLKYKVFHNNFYYLLFIL